MDIVKLIRILLEGPFTEILRRVIFERVNNISPVAVNALLCFGISRGKPWTMTALGFDPHQRDIEFLDRYAMDRWESVLQFLVQPGRGPTAISRDAIRTLLHAGLIERFGKIQRSFALYFFL